MPDSITSIGNYSLANCAFVYVAIGKNVTSIGDYAL